MNTKQFSEALNHLDDRYISEALSYKKKSKKKLWMKWGSLAACACLVLTLGLFAANKTALPISNAPHPEKVEVANPIIEVNSTEEMEAYLDFSLPLLEKAVKTYSVIVTDDYPTIGQIDYEDGSEFRIQYGSEDVSGIYGGKETATEEVSDVTVCYYTASSVDSEITYALWEEDGYSFSYVYTGDGQNEISSLIESFKDLN